MTDIKHEAERLSAIVRELSRRKEKIEVLIDALDDPETRSSAAHQLLMCLSAKHDFMVNQELLERILLVIGQGASLQIDLWSRVVLELDHIRKEEEA